jgi:hypothetical protein
VVRFGVGGLNLSGRDSWAGDSGSWCSFLVLLSELPWAEAFCWFVPMQVLGFLARAQVREYDGW